MADKKLDLFHSIRAKALELAVLIAQECPAGREREAALIRLEESVMHANAGIARKPCPGEPIQLPSEPPVYPSNELPGGPVVPGHELPKPPVKPDNTLPPAPEPKK